MARRAGGASRALLDPVLGAMRELNFPAVLLSAPRDEMQIFGLRPVPQPPGRGVLVHRKLGTVPVQLARQTPRSSDGLIAQQACADRPHSPMPREPAAG